MSRNGGPVTINSKLYTTICATTKLTNTITNTHFLGPGYKLHIALAANRSLRQIKLDHTILCKSGNHYLSS